MWTRAQCELTMEAVALIWGTVEDTSLQWGVRGTVPRRNASFCQWMLEPHPSDVTSMTRRQTCEERAPPRYSSSSRCPFGFTFRPLSFLFHKLGYFKANLYIFVIVILPRLFLCIQKPDMWRWIQMQFGKGLSLWLKELCKVQLHNSPLLQVFRMSLVFIGHVCRHTLWQMDAIHDM